MKKRDLKNGMILVSRDNKTYMVSGDFYRGIKWGTTSDDFNEDLTYKQTHSKDARNNDIVEIYTSTMFSNGSLKDTMKLKNIRKHEALLWKREEPIVKEMTLKQVCELLNMNIKIIKEQLNA